MFLNEIYKKVKEFISGHRYFIICAIVIIIISMFILSCTRKNVSDNGNTVEPIRTELNNAQDAESEITDTASDISNTSTDIAETVGNIAISIDTATGASAGFDAIINQCADIINAVRNQPSNQQ